MNNELHFPYRTRAGRVDVYVSWQEGFREQEDLQITIRGPAEAPAVLCESTRAHIRAEATLRVLVRAAKVRRVGTELDGG